MMKPDVLMVVVSYNGLQHTMKAVQHLQNQTVPIRTLVWDNASTDGTREWLQKHPEVESVCSSKNVLWSPAVNEAIRDHWDGETYVGFMNNDLFIPTEGIQRMLKVAARPEVGMVGPYGSRLGGRQDYASHVGYITGPLQTIQVRLTNSPPVRAAYLIGACCLLRKEVWDEVGPLDEEMPLGADDHDYSIRLKQAGYHLMVAADVYVQHVGHATGSSPLWSEWGKKSWARFNEKWAGYYKDKEEAVHSHWGGVYVEGYEK